jgi:ADP-ribose pyrophosphatase
MPVITPLEDLMDPSENSHVNRAGSRKVAAWRKLAEETIVVGHRKVARRTFELPDGTLSDFEIKLEAPIVCVLPVTTAGTVILAKQFRPGPEAVLLELPGGRIDLERDETPLAAIQRELLEETGYTGTFHYLGQSYHCAYSTRITHSFVATSCTQVSESQHTDVEEFIEVVEMPLDQFKDHLASGRLSDVETGLLGLQFLHLL